jgi:DNA repair protein RadC
MRLREHIAVWGPGGLSDVDALAVVIGVGVPGLDARAVAAALLDRFDGLSGVASASVAELASVRGVGAVTAARVLAALTLGRRLYRDGPAPDRIEGPRDAARLLAPALAPLEFEELHAAYVDRRHRVLARVALTRGSAAFTVVDPAQVYRPAVRLGASGVVLAHNHPSGDPAASDADVQVTRRVDAAGRALGVRLLDHLIVAGDRVTSLAEQGVLVGWEASPGLLT